MYALPDLPYDYEALEPAISADTLHFHHDKHHKAYVEKTNELAEKAGLASKPLEEVVREASRKGDKKLFNNAAQAWNHAFFWECMAPGGKACTGQLKARIEETFGSVDAFKDAFVEEGFSHFASGWVWLVMGSDGLKVISTHDAEDTLVKEGLFPLLVCDLWEHAYYLDYQNDRKGFLKAWLDGAANYFFGEQQMFAADGQISADGGNGFKYPEPNAFEGRGEPAGHEDRPTV